MNEALRWFDQLREWGFSPAQAHEVWLEHRAIASPILWSRRALRQDARLRAGAWAQRTLRERLLTIDHPRAWEHYWKAMPDFLRYMGRRISQRGRHVAGAMEGLWPLIAMGEDIDGFRTRIEHPQAAGQWAMGGWDDLVEFALRHRVLDRLVEQVPPMELDEGEAAWQQTLHETGLRSIRWGWLDSVAAKPGRLRAGLVMAQNQLGAGVGWRGQILGLGGSTSLVLMDRGRGNGIVQPDPGGSGQTMTIDTWTVLAHEWAHLLDRRVSVLADGKRPWATTCLLQWKSEEDPGPLLLAWLESLNTVMIEAPDATALADNRQEAGQWALRATMALGGLGPVREEIIRQQHLMDQGGWTIEDAERGWLRLLDDRPLAVVPAQVRQTAQLLAHDGAYAVLVQQQAADGSWMDYLSRLPEADQGPGEDARQVQAGGCTRYLTHPVEIMARSFEAAMGCDRALDNVWIPHALRPNAGLTWPLLAEARLQRASWNTTLAQLAQLSGTALGLGDARNKP